MRQQPPHDPEGNVVPHDHPQIEGGQRVVRRISKERIVMRADGRRTLSSQCFKPSSDPTAGLSIDIEAWLIEDGIDVENFVSSPQFTASVVLPVSEIRELALQVGWDPIEETEKDPGNQYHGEIWGVGRNNKRRQKALQAISDWLVPLEGVDIT